MNRPLLAVALKSEQDVVSARQRARQIAELLGFDVQCQTRIATAVSEIARNAFRYASGGWVEFGFEGSRAPQLMRIRVVDAGPGIRDLQSILDGRYRSNTGMGLGILGARRLMDQFDIRSREGEGTEVVLTKILPAWAPLIRGERVADLASALAATRPVTTLQELEQQNRELMQALTELRERQEEMTRLNRELEDTNRGVVALYAELDERADHLRRADETKTRFLSNMSHEFRTPLNSIRALSRLLLDRVDGPLNDEQAKQVALIRKATEDLTDMVDDLLDLAKISAGKAEVRPTEFAVAELFGMLRGMLRPLLAPDKVALHFDDVSALPPLYTDERKVSQILRNLVSNALKYTEQGEVRVSAEVVDAGCQVCICVRDTGIGIAPEDQETIFEEFTQVPGPLQGKIKGTGLGLPLSRRLAALLGGTLGVESALGTGSTFRLTVPIRFAAAAAEPTFAPLTIPADPRRLGVLVVDNDAAMLAEYERMLHATAFQVLPARSIRQAQDLLVSNRPAAIVMEVDLRGENGWEWLGELKSEPETRRLPIVVVSHVDDPSKAHALGADACLSKPPAAGELVATLDALTSLRVLVIDDDPVARYTVRRFLGPDVPALEAEDGISGLRAAAQLQPQAILLDLQLPDLNGGEVLKQLKSSPRTRDIPVAILTSHDLDEDARSALSVQAVSVVSKRDLSAEVLCALVHRLAARRMVEA